MCLNKECTVCLRTTFITSYVRYNKMPLIEETQKRAWKVFEVVIWDIYTKAFKIFARKTLRTVISDYGWPMKPNLMHTFWDEISSRPQLKMCGIGVATSAHIAMKKYWELAELENEGFFWVGHFEFFFRKKKIFFASFPWKSAQIYMVEWMGWNFDVFPGFQKIPCYA